MTDSHISPWLTAAEATDRARCGERMIYAEIKVGRLKAARIWGRREYRLLPEWVDEWLQATREARDRHDGKEARVRAIAAALKDVEDLVP